MRSKLKTTWRVLKWLGISLLAYYLTFGDGWRDLTFGRFHRKAQTMFSDTSGVTEVRVYLLMGREAQRTASVFPIRPYGTTEPVCGEIVLTGDQLGKFLDHWHWQSPSYWRQALCHDPAYGFRLYRGPLLMTETSICWHCSNFYVDMWPLGASWYGFDSESKPAQDLLIFCDKLLPYARPPVKNKEPEKR